MNRALLLLPLALVCTAAPLLAEPPVFKPIVEKIDLQDGDTLVFLGDSITHQCLYTQYVEDYYYTRYPKLGCTFTTPASAARAEETTSRASREQRSFMRER